MSDTSAFVLIAFVGLFPILAAVFDWDFFFNNYKARPVVKVLGRSGARIFYAVLGTVIIVISFVAVAAGYKV